MQLNVLDDQAEAMKALDGKNRGCYVMCDVDVCSWIRATRFKTVFEWGVKQAPREAPDSECWGPSFGPLREANVFQRGQKWTLLGSKRNCGG